MANEIIQSEKDKYKKIYSDIMFSYDDLRQMLDENELNKRTFINKVETLKDYMDFLDRLESESKKDKGFFKKLFNKSEDVESKINNYLTIDKKRDIDKLQKCSKCKCINCVSNCMVNSCLNCREEEYVYGCDKKTDAFTKTKETVTLYDGNKEIIFNVAGYLIEKSDNNIFRYVYLIDSKDYDNQHLLRYSKFKGEESYDSVIIDDSQDELIRLNNKFIELGLTV
ncbi:hypothetical protein [Romboutsia sp. 1001713B170131_170501_G6]|uniref:hypothetical protein n=1 Tax=Romboutsia sp. 1001713B170131_170501_G6 TaxID=2787108 RepID=UPI0018A95593|nr:hypothetical protein [Romboutsia sp. 1001713B170131_170501_G6]